MSIIFGKPRFVEEDELLGESDKNISMCYSKYCHDYYYIFVYMEKGVVMNSKIIRSEGTPIDSDTKIKHYMRNGLKY